MKKKEELNISEELTKLRNNYLTVQTLFLNKTAEIDKQIQELKELKDLLSDQYNNLTETYENERDKLLTEQSRSLLKL